jgi:alpha-tubulin suppressor-like RCC1 family protein
VWHALHGLLPFKIAAGAHSLLVTTGGVVYSCGRGRHGQLGTGRLENVEKWTRVETITGAPLRAVPVKKVELAELLLGTTIT